MNRNEVRLLPGAPLPADGYLRRAVLGTICGYLIAGAPIPTDGYLRRWAHEDTSTIAAPAFPTQYSGLRYWDGVAVRDLCLVASASYATGMGGALFVKGSAATYAIYLVDSADPTASPFPVRTTSTKFIRLKT